jgi:hypothetical protein
MKKVLLLRSSNCGHVSPKRRLTFNGLHSLLSQKTDIVITAVNRRFYMALQFLQSHARYQEVPSAVVTEQSKWKIVFSV